MASKESEIIRLLEEGYDVLVREEFGQKEGYLLPDYVNDGYWNQFQIQGLPLSYKAEHLTILNAPKPDAHQVMEQLVKLADDNGFSFVGTVKQKPDPADAGVIEAINRNVERNADWKREEADGDLILLGLRVSGYDVVKVDR